MGKFLDGVDHKYTLQWYIKGIAEIVRLGSYSFGAAILLAQFSEKLAVFFGVLLVYNVVGLFLFFYNANESELPNIICAGVLLGWSIVVVWPKKWGGLKKV